MKEHWLKGFHEVTTARCWPAVAGDISALLATEVAAKDYFHTHWSESGEYIRESFNDDARLAVWLRTVLPPYRGGGMTLFRGENAVRYNEGLIGFCWTEIEDAARMFGSGRNAFHGGGVLLRCDVLSSSIIAGPGAHSRWLGESEYVVDPFSLSGIEVIDQFADMSAHR